MSAVLRLTWTYFTATPLMRWMAGVGLVCAIAGLIGYSFMPPWTLASGMRQSPIWWQSVVLLCPWLGLILLLAASAFMPAILERIALGRSIWVLPSGRIRLLISALIPALFLTLVTATGATLAFVDYPIEVSLGRTFYRTLLMAFVDFGLIYTAFWLVGKTSGVWRLAGTLGIVVSITFPLRYVGGIPPFSWLEGVGLASWVLFAAILLSGGRIRHSASAWRARAKAFANRLLPSTRYEAGREVDLLLGTNRPWAVAIGQMIPIGVVAWLVPVAEVWIVFFVTFGAISGALTSQAAARSRRLWLRYDLTRDEIRRRVEWAYWKYNFYSLFVLIVAYVGLGANAGLPNRSLAVNALLIAVCYFNCIYLGLMITRGLGWFESILGIVTMVVLVLIAFFFMRNDYAVGYQLMALLVGLGIMYLFFVRDRWRKLDWMQCRIETSARGAS